VVVLAVVVFVVAKPFSGPGTSAGSSRPLSPTVPGCVPGTAKGLQLNQVTSHPVMTGGNPFDVVTLPGYAFVSGGGRGLAVLSTSTPVPTVLWSNPLTHAQGEAITPNGQYLLVTGGSGITIFRVSSLEHQPGTSPMGSLTIPGQKHAEDVAVTPDGRYAFVTFQKTGRVGVLDLQRAFAHGLGAVDFVGLIPVGPQPIGIAMARDGQHAYVASGQAHASNPGAGVLSVIDVPRAEQHPGPSAVAARVPAGCEANRVVLSPGGKVLWVTAVGSNALLGFSTARLLSDPEHALLARVAVGPEPLGLAVIRHGTRIVVADSDRDGKSGLANLAVVDAGQALAGRPALLGYVPSGRQPRQFALVSGGRTLLVTDTESAQVQAVDLGHLP
jgi:DNA-binding beta-propeller fold protein YncE